MGYTTYFQTLANVSDHKKAEMAKIYFQYYAGSDEARFYNDLADKDEVLFLDYDNQMVGFTSLQFYPFLNHMVVYSGDTIVMPAHRQQQSLHQAWIGRVGQLKQHYPDKKIYWFLLVKGYKTYKYLVLFAKSFYPHWQQDNPELADLAQQLAVAKFGDLYCSATGVVECPSHYGYLKEGGALLAPHEEQKAAAQFFLQANPHYQKGHELVCLCELTEENLTRRAQKVFCDAKVECLYA